VLDHRASFRLCGRTRLAFKSRVFQIRLSIERPSLRAWWLDDLPVRYYYYYSFYFYY